LALQVLQAAENGHGTAGSLLILASTKIPHALKATAKIPWRRILPLYRTNLNSVANAVRGITFLLHSWQKLYIFTT